MVYRVSSQRRRRVVKLLAAVREKSPARRSIGGRPAYHVDPLSLPADDLLAVSSCDFGAAGQAAP